MPELPIISEAEKKFCLDRPTAAGERTVSSPCMVIWGKQWCSGLDVIAWQQSAARYINYAGDAAKTSEQRARVDLLKQQYDAMYRGVRKTRTQLVDEYISIAQAATCLVLEASYTSSDESLGPFEPQKPPSQSFPNLPLPAPFHEPQKPSGFPWGLVVAALVLGAVLDDH